jgi:hypothetical protein
MLARTAREQKRYAAAYELFQGTIDLSQKGAGRYAQTSSVATEEQAALVAHVALLELDLRNAPAGSVVTIDGKTTTSDEWTRPHAVEPGERHVSLKAPDERTVDKDFTLVAGQTTHEELGFDAGPPPEVAPKPARSQAAKPETATSSNPSKGSNGLRTASYVAGGVGVAGLATFGVFGLLNNSTYSDLEDRCPENRCPESAQSDIDRGKNYQLFANIGLVVGVVGIGTGVTLFALSSGHSDEGELRAVISPTGASLRGRF